MRRERRRRRGREEGEGVDKNREIAKIVISTKIVLICAKLRSKCARTLRNVTERFRSCWKARKASVLLLRGGGEEGGPRVTTATRKHNGQCCSAGCYKGRERQETHCDGLDFDLSPAHGVD